MNTVSLKDALIASGINVTISDVSETAWNNTNPSLTDFNAVIHMNGTTYNTEMPLAGQEALVDFVENKGGCYIGSEWNNYEVDDLNKMQSMIDLVLLKRDVGASGTVTYELVNEEASHPVLKGISNFSFNSETNGTVRAFKTQPSVVLMTGNVGDAVVVRELDEGKVLGFSHAGNYNTGISGFSDENIQDIIINFINWK